MSIRGGPTITTSGLTVALDSGDAASYVSGSGTVWYDLSGNRYTASLLSLTLNGTPTTFDSNFTVQSNNLGTIYFKGNGGAAYGSVDVNTAVGGTTITRTFEAWFNSKTTGQQLILGWLGYNTGVVLAGGSIRLWNFVRSGDNTQYLNFHVVGPTYTTGSWYHVVNVLSSTKSQMYVNGNFYAETAVTDFSFFLSGPYKVGGTYYILGTNPAEYQYDAANAEIPIARIYNRGLSAAEVLQNYAAQKARFGG